MCCEAPLRLCVKVTSNQDKISITALFAIESHYQKGNI